MTHDHRLTVLLHAFLLGGVVGTTAYLLTTHSDPLLIGAGLGGMGFTAVVFAASFVKAWKRLEDRRS